MYISCGLIVPERERSAFKGTKRPRQDSNLESSDPKSDAFSIRPRGLFGNRQVADWQCVTPRQLIKLFVKNMLASVKHWERKLCTTYLTGRKVKGSDYAPACALL